MVTDIKKNTITEDNVSKSSSSFI